MEGHKTKPSETVSSLEEMVNSRQGLGDRDRKDLLELAQTQGLTPTDMQEVFDMLNTALV